MSKRLARFYIAPLSLALEFSLVVNNPRFIDNYIEDDITHGDIEEDSIYEDIENSTRGSDFARSVSIRDSVEFSRISTTKLVIITTFKEETGR